MHAPALQRTYSSSLSDSAKNCQWQVALPLPAPKLVHDNLRLSSYKVQFSLHGAMGQCVPALPCPTPQALPDSSGPAS